MFNLKTTQSINLVMTGIISISGLCGGPLIHDKEVSSREIMKVVQPAHREELIPIKADPHAKITFERISITSSPRSEPKPRQKATENLNATNVNPSSVSSKNFNVERTIIAAKREIGQIFPTGWNQPGECIVAAQRWIHKGGGSWYGGGTPLGNYVNAKEVSSENAAPGDIIQYVSLESPSLWVTGVHTVLVTKNNRDGTLQIIEANNPGGSGLVSENKRWTPTPPKGFEARTFRF